MKSKLLLIFIAVMFCVSFASAIELNPFADVKIYEPAPTEDMPDYLKTDFNSKYGVIRLSNTFLWIETSKIAEYSLIHNTEICVDCEQLIKVTLYTDMPLFDKIDYNLLGSDKPSSITNEKILIQKTETYEVIVPDKTERICIEGELFCHINVLSNKTIEKTREIWDEYNGETLIGNSSGVNYVYKITGRIGKESVDVIQTSDGKEFTEWAPWVPGDCRGLGGTITIDGDYCVHTFLTNSSFNNTLPIDASLNASILVVAGGGGGVGGGAASGSGGGGGAGGVLYNTSLVIPAGFYNVTVGVGAIGVTAGTAGKDGSYSRFWNTTDTGTLYYNSVGGGGGGVGGGSNGNGRNGGSGGGGGSESGVGGAGSAGQGNAGGNGAGASHYACGGGGGASTVGMNAVEPQGGWGGNGTLYSINGSLVYYGGGGGGGSYSAGGIRGYGGLGGGGNSGDPDTDGAGSDGVDGLGGGGGGGSFDPTPAGNGGSGGDGIVIIRYLVQELPSFSATLSYPAIETNTSDTTVDIGCNFTATNANITGVDLNVSLNFIQKYYNFIGLNTSSYNATWTTTTLTDGKYNITCIGYGSTGENATATGRFNLNTTPVINNVEYLAQATEYRNLSYILNATSVYSPTARLYYNNVSYTSTYTLNGSQYIFTSYVMPNAGNNSIKWSILANSVNVNSSTYYQNVIPINFSFCNYNSIQNVTYLNITFKDETTSGILNATIDLSSWTYYTNDITKNKTFSFTSSIYNYSYAFCATPADETIYVLPKIQYASTGYPQRTYEPTALTLNNITTNKTLYLLSSTEGLYVTFQVVNAASQAISGADVTVTRIDTGSIYSGVTDASGSVTFWLNSNYPHTVSVVASGYPSYSATITPTQSTYTITLTSSAGTTTNYGRQVAYSIKPTDNYLLNGTSYSFNLTINSSYWTITQWGFALTNGSTILQTASSTDNGGTLNVVQVTNKNSSSIVMNYYWVVNGTSTNGSRIWYISDMSGTDWSIGNFFTDLKNYVNPASGVGIFGLTSFGLAIIVFLVIFIFAGALSYQFGLNSPAAIMVLIFALTAFFDVAVGIVPNPVNAIIHFPTIFIGIIMVGVLIREATQ